MIALAHRENPAKTIGSEKFLPQLQQCINGWRKQDPVSQKKLPVKANIPVYLVKCGLDPCASESNKAIGNLSLIGFYYLLRVGENTMKSKRGNTKQMVQFKMEDIVFCKDKWGWLRCLPQGAPDLAIASATRAALKLDNQKNGWKGVSIYQEMNGDPVRCPVHALGQGYMHICKNGGKKKTFLSAYYEGGIEANVTAEHTSRGLKIAAAALDYLSPKGIPIKRTDTHSLRSGGANTLALSSFLTCKFRRWDAGKVQPFRSMCARNLRVSPPGCHLL
jgi:hypothetical protein